MTKINSDNVNLKRLLLILSRLERGESSPSELQQFPGLSDFYSVMSYLDFLERGRFVEIQIQEYRPKGPVQSRKTVRLTERGKLLLRETNAYLKLLSLGNEDEKDDSEFEALPLLSRSETGALLRSISNHHSCARRPRSPFRS